MVTGEQFDSVVSCAPQLCIAGNIICFEIISNLDHGHTVRVKELDVGRG